MYWNRSKKDNEGDPVVEDEEPREFDDEETREIGEDKFNHVIKNIESWPSVEVFYKGQDYLPGGFLQIRANIAFDKLHNS